MKNFKYNPNQDYKVEGYYNRWTIIDSYANYVLLENNTWGDETCYLVCDALSAEPKEYRSKDSGETITIPTFPSIICETYDDIEQALIDEGIIK